MLNETHFYRSRHLTPEQRQAALAERKRQHVPWHAPPHYSSVDGHYLITAACYEHRPHIGFSYNRLAEFEAQLLQRLHPLTRQVIAWVVLPNHYHVLLVTTDLASLLKGLGQLHGRTSYYWNNEEERRGRKVWYRCAETAMKSERHSFATVNYVMNNAVRHGYVERCQDWPYSNAAEYLDALGRDNVIRRWKDYPILDFGRDWDPPEL
jgi:putative transposase